MMEEQKSQPALPHNAASRALRVVAAIQSVADNMVQRAGGVIVSRIIWSSVYRKLFGEVSPLDIGWHLRAVIQAFDEVGKFIARGEIKGLTDKNNQIRTLAQLIESSVHNLSGSSAEIRLNFDMLDLVLEICAYNMPEEPSLGDDAAQIRRELEECGEEIRNSNLDADIKEFCLRHIAEMIRALDGYEVVGGQFVRKTVVGFADEADQMPPKKREQIPKTFKNAAGKFIAVAEKINVLGQLAKNIAGLLG